MMIATAFCKHFEDNFEKQEFSKIIKEILEGISAKTSLVGAAITQNALEKHTPELSDLSSWTKAGLLDYNKGYEVKDCFVYFLLNHMGYIEKNSFE